MSDEFQRMNYVTGFGVKKARKAGIASARITKGVQAVSGILGAAGFGDKMMGSLSYPANTDLNAITQAMLSTNGMRTVFPNLWTYSNYAKSINIDFEFISPYGDPFSTD